MQRRRTEPRLGVIFLFLPLCICFCRVGNIEVLTGVFLQQLLLFIFLPTDIPFSMIRHHRYASTTLVPLGCPPFSGTSSMWYGLRYAHERELCLEPPSCTMAPPRLAKSSLSSSFSSNASMNGLGLLQQAKTWNDLAEFISAEREFARVMCPDCWNCPRRHTRTTNSGVARINWHRSMLSCPPCKNETHMRQKSEINPQMLSGFPERL